MEKESPVEHSETGFFVALPCKPAPPLKCPHAVAEAFSDGRSLTLALKLQRRRMAKDLAQEPGHFLYSQPPPTRSRD